MGMSASSKTYYNVDEVLRFPDDGNKYELIYGELVVNPTPRLWHQEVVMRLTHLLLDYCKREPVGRVFCVGADLTWGRSDVITQPDVFVLAPEDRGVEHFADVTRRARAVGVGTSRCIATARDRARHVVRKGMTSAPKRTGAERKGLV